MFDTYFEEQAAMGDVKDYKDSRPPNQLLAICTCGGRISSGEPACERNPEHILKHKGQGYCMHYCNWGANHCDHRWADKR
jgi:hypothetical protein